MLLCWKKGLESEEEIFSVKQTDNFLLFSQKTYTEGVGQTQPRVCFETLGQLAPVFSDNPERVRQGAWNHNGNEPFQGCHTMVT